MLRCTLLTIQMQKCLSCAHMLLIQNLGLQVNSCLPESAALKKPDKYLFVKNL
jgi:hypothetical protein